MKHSPRHIAAAIGLIFVAPLVAEFLLGNLPIKLLPALIVLGPMYGGGALLIREVARRSGRGWPTMLLLGAAYTFIEEGLVTQSLFNPDYLRIHMHLLDHAYIPALGIGAWWTVFMLNLHTFWSVSVSIALVEALIPGDSTAPWLGKIGDAVVTVVFLIGIAANVFFTVKTEHFVASHSQFLMTVVVCLCFIGIAFLVPRRSLPSGTGAIPNAWVTGVMAWVFGVSVLITPSGWNWEAVAILLALDTVFLAMVWALSRSRHWTPLHTLSLASGGALAYGLHAFIENPVTGNKEVLLLRIGNVIFLAGAITLIAVGVKRIAR